MYILCTVDHDDTSLHGIKEIFYAKFTSVILPEIVSRQPDMITDKEIYLMHMSTSSVWAHDILYDSKAELYNYLYVNITSDPPKNNVQNNPQKQSWTSIELIDTDYWMSFFVL